MTQQLSPRSSRVGPAIVAILAVLAILTYLVFFRGGSSPTPSGPPGTASGPLPTATLTAGATPSPAATPLPTFPRNPAPIIDGTPYVQAIDPAMFVEGVDNPFFPMVKSATFVFDGDEHIEVTVLAETKDILGVAATVVRDQVFADGELAEDTLDWYAQDRQGNVWYLGEQTAEYENGKVTSTAGSWEAGVDGAQPGIVMLAHPQAGDRYRQEFYAGEAEDLAEVTAVSGSVSVPAGSWSGSDVLVTEEWTPLEPDVRERKTYARGVGVVEIRTIKGGREVTTLTKAEFPAAAAGVAFMGFVGLTLRTIWRRSPGVRSRRKLGSGRHEG
jgi:hypothetical protein